MSLRKIVSVIALASSLLLGTGFVLPTQAQQSSVNTLMPSDLALSFPYGTGALVNDNGTIYFISGRSKVPFTSWQAFVGLGYSLKNVVKGNLTNYKLAQKYISTSNMAHPRGTWLIYKGTVYFSAQDGLIGVPSEALFLSNKGNWQSLVKANRYDVAVLNANPHLPLLVIYDDRVSQTGFEASVPVILQLSPNSGPVGNVVTITGSGFMVSGNKIKFGNLGSENNPQYSLDSFDGKTLTFTVPSSNYLSCWSSSPACMAPATLTQPGAYQVSVINTNGTSNSLTFTVTSGSTAAPVINSLSPSSGPTGTVVTIIGSGFTSTGNTVIGQNIQQPEITVILQFAGSLNSSNGTTLQFTIPSSAGLYCPVGQACAQYLQQIFSGAYAISVINSNGTSNSATFTVTP